MYASTDMCCICMIEGSPPQAPIVIFGASASLRGVMTVVIKKQTLNERLLSAYKTSHDYFESETGFGIAAVDEYDPVFLVQK